MCMLVVMVIWCACDVDMHVGIYVDVYVVMHVYDNTDGYMNVDVDVGTGVYVGVCVIRMWICM